MMDISKMSDEHKSVLLARGMGWYVYNAPLTTTDDLFKRIIVDSSRVDVGLVPLGGGVAKRDVPMKLNLYDPANMALAKRAIAWGFENDDAFNEWLSDKTTALEVLIYENGIRRALDYLVEPLAIEAGMIEEE